MEKVIGGRYRLLRCIGKGGMSAVYLVEDLQLQKQWAMKRIPKPQNAAGDDREKRSMLRELAVLKSLQHPGIPRIVDMYESGEAWFLIMDYIEGESLQSLLEKGRAFSDKEIEEIGKSLCRILLYLHRKQIIYQDLKPANIMLTEEGNLWLLDYGAIMQAEKEEKVRAGTPAFAAPEQLKGEKVDERTDVYSWGKVLAYLYQKDGRKIPPAFKEILSVCLQEKAEKRYPNMKALLRQLESKAVKSSRILRRSLLLSLVLLVFIVGEKQNLQNFQEEKSYQRLLREAEESRDEEEKRKLAEEAIAMRGEDMQAYFTLLDAIRFDGIFSKEEEEEVKSLYFEKKETLVGKEDYALFCYEIGMLYWICYGDVENETAGLVKSGSWFEDALRYGGEEAEFYARAKICKKISDFYGEITLAKKEARDGGMYRQYFEEIEEMLALSEKTGEELFRAQAIRLSLSSLESYALQMKLDGVEEEEMEKLYAEAMQAAEELPENGERLRSIKKACLEQKETLEKVIESSYKGGEAFEEN